MLCFCQLSHKQVLKQIRCAVSGGPPISPEKFDFEWSLVFAQAANIVENDRIVLRQLHLVQGGDVIDVSDANAPEYLRAFERMYLGDGVALQIRALQSGFYSIIPQEHVAILGPSGLLHSLGCLTCPEFDLEDLRFGLEPKHGYDTQSPQYVWLIETLSKFDEPQRRALVRFLTGSPWLPNGFQGLQTRLTVQLQTTKEGKPADDSYFPVAQTCAGLFKLPRLVAALLPHSLSYQLTRRRSPRHWGICTDAATLLTLTGLQLHFRKTTQRSAAFCNI